MTESIEEIMDKIWDTGWKHGGFDDVEGAHSYDDVIEFWYDARHFQLTLTEVLPAKAVGETRDCGFVECSTDMLMEESE